MYLNKRRWSVREFIVKLPRLFLFLNFKTFILYSLRVYVYSYCYKYRYDTKVFKLARGQIDIVWIRPILKCICCSSLIPIYYRPYAKFYSHSDGLFSNLSGRYRVHRYISFSTPPLIWLLEIDLVPSWPNLYNR